MEVGAIEVPVNPASTPAELSGFVQQVDPRADRDRRRPLAPPVTSAVRETGSTATVVDIDTVFTGEADGRGPARSSPTPSR